MLPWLILIFCYILQAGSIPCDDDANIGKQFVHLVCVLY